MKAGVLPTSVVTAKVLVSGALEKARPPVPEEMTRTRTRGVQGTPVGWGPPPPHIFGRFQPLGKYEKPETLESLPSSNESE